ncbi:MAG: oxidoreductase [Bacteroidota bacterium]|nr:oxidoreductase [Bacteroidota bacterium]MDP4215377.1 oxidoreductase [Bacteroidota bacterium]MDP4244521.1 oxidoreductase [Bacteroidota bacterium]MDP4259937.1 oxidoreductase [Bacteroidota bacterium]
MNPKWNAANIPDLRGRTAIVTGASGGVGYEIAFQLAVHGAHVILASRNHDRTSEAARRIKAAAPKTSVEVQLLDLADLHSVRRFTTTFSERHHGLDILVNNAGASGGPHRLTKDGLEAHFQINYLGHFALTGLLMSRLSLRAGSRVVSMSSDIASQGRIHFEDLQSQHKYGFVRAYAQSKLANLLFAFELDRRCRQAGNGVMSLATNPGVARSGLLIGKDADWGRPRSGTENLLRILQNILAQPAEKGALPALYQATDPSATSSEYVIGTKWPRPGYPSSGKIPRAALDRTTARQLWEISEKLTGVYYTSINTDHL